MDSRHHSRRSFLQQAIHLGVGATAAGLVINEPFLQWLLHDAGCGNAHAGGPLDELLRRAPRARFWTSPATASTVADCQACHAEMALADPDLHTHSAPDTIQCLLCAQSCLIKPGDRGRCGVRYNHEGILRSLSYGRPAAVHVDPIEKKPFYHFLPGRQALSFGTVGCALHCKFCQNWELSQARPEDAAGAYVEPGRIVATAAKRQAPVIAFTYNEPTVFAEYLLDIARLARIRGLRTALVSCGFMNEAPLAEMCESLDAIKIDLKGFSPDFYRRVCSAELDPVLRSIKQVARSDVHLELVNLVVPTLNDSPEMMTGLCRWVADELGPDVPIHFTRFHPDYQLMNLAPTPISTLERARDIAGEHGLRYAYVGNVPGHPGNQTYCPECGEVVISRKGFLIEGELPKDGKCGTCGTSIAGVWQ